MASHFKISNKIPCAKDSISFFFVSTGLSSRKVTFASTIFRLSMVIEGSASPKFSTIAIIYVYSDFCHCLKSRFMILFLKSIIVAIGKFPLAESTNKTLTESLKLMNKFSSKIFLLSPFATIVFEPTFCI